jgi:phosphoribosylformylglycinamidine synthase
VALAELCVRGGLGASVSGVRGHHELFCELPSRFLVATHQPDGVASRARAAGVPVDVLGTAGGERLVVDGLCDLSLEDLRDASRRLEPTELAGH